MAILGPFDFRGGYSPGYEFTTLPPKGGFATTMENCRSINGYINLRFGQNNVVSGTSLSGGVPVNGLTAWIDTVNSKTALIATCNTKLYIGDITGYLPSSAAITFTDRTGAITIGGKQTFDSLNNILVVAGNSSASVAPNKVTAYNANAVALGGSPPTADCVKQVNNFMFLSRNLSSTTTQSRVYWSNVNDPETWTGTNVLDFNKNDGETITALGAIGTDLYIFKPHSIGRLGTTTLTVSGAITLGPLSTVIRGIGCCGPLALDNLPNGNIVFVGTDGHFYEFDGATVVDRSKAPYPGLNAYDSGQYMSGDHWHYGIRAGNADTNVAVKFWPGINEVWISYKTSLNNLGNICFMYDADQQIWQGIGNSSNGAGTFNDINPTCFATTPSPLLNSALTSESTSLLFYGNLSNGQIVVLGNTNFPYPTDNGATIGAENFAFGTTIQLGGQGMDFIPRSIIFETSQTQSAHAMLSSLSLYADYDVYMPETTNTNKRIYNGSGALPTRVIVNLPFYPDTQNTTVVAPTLLSLLWVGVGTGAPVSQSCIFRFGKFYLSDEIIR